MDSKLHLKTKPTLADIQQYVIAMEAERGFDHQSLVEQCLLLIEEVGELCKVIRKHHTSMGIDTSKQYDLDAEGEIADITVMLCCIANRLGIDMEQAFRDKEEKNKRRSWK